MTDEDKCKAIIDKIADILRGESVEDGLNALSWVMANVIVNTAHKDKVLTVSARMATDVISTVMFLMKEEKETLQ